MPERDDIAELPTDLVDALKSTDRAPAVVTRVVDRLLADAASAQFGERGVPGVWRRSRRWAALAASIALVGVLAVRWDHWAGPDEALYTDLDGSGTIDIADVLALARNGTASADELDAFARRVVAVDGGTSQ